LHKEFAVYEPVQRDSWSLNPGTSLLLISLFLISFLFALKRVLQNRLYDFDTQESRDFWGLEWFNPGRSDHEGGVRRDFVPRFCERISSEEFEY
jgi:hypothetical protein